MSRSIRFGVGALALLLTLAAWRMADSPSGEPVFEARSVPAEAGPLCPWRDPTSDLKIFFPMATRTETERRILSGARVEMANRLGRSPSGDENALQVYRVYRENTLMGDLLTRRVKGAHGAIEIVVAVESGGKTRGVRLQRLREPPGVASILQDSDFLGGFVGRSAAELGGIRQGLKDLPPDAQVSAAAILDGVFSLLVLHAVSETTRPTAGAPARHH